MHSRGVLGNGRSVARKVTLQHSGAGRGKTEPSVARGFSRRFVSASMFAWDEDVGKN